MDAGLSAGQAERDGDLRPGTNRIGAVGRGDEAPLTNSLHRSLVESCKATAGGHGHIARPTFLVDQYFQPNRTFLTCATRRGRISRLDAIAGLEILCNGATRRGRG